MNMVDLSVFLPHIKQYAPGVPIPTAYFALRQAAIDFCTRTKLWRYEDEYDVAAEDSDDISAPNNAVILDLEAVYFDGFELTPKTPAWLDENARGWRTNEVTGGPAKYITQIEVNTFRLVPAATGHINIYSWLKPSQDADQLPAFLGDQYREVIAHGALARILIMPGMPFSNPSMGAVFASSFSGSLDSTQHKGITGQQRARPRTRGNFF